jgi:Sec-independent protein translocase protein TatA
MPFLSPAKFLVILVIALVVLGPDKLPKVAKQIGALWGDFRGFRQKLESEVRGNFPTIPSTDTITQAVRSPLSFLDSLAGTDIPESRTTVEATDGAEFPPVQPEGTQSSSGMNATVGTVVTKQPPSMPGPLLAIPVGIVHRIRANGGVEDDSGMN